MQRSEMQDRQRRSEYHPLASAAQGLSTIGGTAPLIATGLIKWTGSELAPAYMLIGASVLILIVIAAIRETAFEDEAGPAPVPAVAEPARP